eukprot:gene210-287_t
MYFYNTATLRRFFTLTCLTEKRKVASFDPKKYVGAFISDGGLRHERAVIEKAVNQLCSEIPKDARHGANGHDFIELLFNFLWEKDSLQLHDKRADVTSYG